MRDDRAEGFQIVLRELPTRLRQRGRCEHAQPHGFAMTEAAVFADGFQRVSHRMPEIQDAALTVFVFVRHDDVRLDPAAIPDERCQHGDVTRKNRGQRSRQLVEQRT